MLCDWEVQAGVTNSTCGGVCDLSLILSIPERTGGDSLIRPIKELCKGTIYFTFSVAASID